jgi:VanZ family protein
MSHRVALAWSWTVLILALCWCPGNLLPVPETGLRIQFTMNLDKLVHFGLFAVYAYLWARADGQPGLANPARVLLAGLFFTVISELGQLMPFVGRDASVEDGIADMIGVVLGLMAFAMLPARIKVPSAGTP